MLARGVGAHGGGGSARLDPGPPSTAASLHGEAAVLSALPCTESGRRVTGRMAVTVGHIARTHLPGLTQSRGTAAGTQAAPL